MHPQTLSLSSTNPRGHSRHSTLPGALLFLLQSISPKIPRILHRNSNNRISSPPSMASIHFSVSPYSTSVRSSPSFVSYKPQRIAAQAFSRDSCSSSSRCRSVFAVSAGRRRSCVVRSSLETAGPTAAVGQVTEVDKDTFWPIVKAAGDKTVVLDMYTQWCGPCKIIAPKFQALSEKYLDVVFLKLDCNQDNKLLAKELGIRVVPTFKILKDSKIVKEVTGAKIDDLVASIEAVRSS